MRTAVAIAMAVSVFGLSFGVVAAEAGMGNVRSCAASLLVFGGGSQFAAVGVVTAGGSQAAAVLTGLLLNVRFLAFGLAVAPVLGDRLVARLIGSQVIVDETTAVTIAEPDRVSARRAFWLTGGSLFLVWNLATLAGAELGGVIDDPSDLGIDAAFPAVFLALLDPRLASRDEWWSAVVAVVVALALVPLVPAGLPVMAGALAAGAVVSLRGRTNRTGHQ